VYGWLWAARQGKKKAALIATPPERGEMAFLFASAGTTTPA